MALDVKVHFVDEGAGSPVLFLHGFPDCGDMWSGIISRLRGRFRCVAPDLPGHGQSLAGDDFDLSLENRSRFIDALLEDLGIQAPINLIVHDHGGPYGLAWAVRHPEKVKRIVITNTIFFSDYRWHFWAKIWRTPVLGELSLALLNWPLFHREMRRGSRQLTTEQIRGVYARIDRKLKRMCLRLYRATDPRVFIAWEGPLRDLVAHIPTMVLWGDHDPFIPKSFAERFGAQQVYHFPEAGHWLPVESAEEVAERLLKFLE